MPIQRCAANAWIRRIRIIFGGAASLRQCTSLVHHLKNGSVGHESRLVSTLLRRHSEARTTASKTLLRKEEKSTGPTDSTIQINEEREAGAAGVFGTVVKAVQAKTKLNIMLGRGFSPSKVMRKMKITSLKDKKFNNFARYYARYLAKYPKKAATMPATAEDVAMLIKMKGWVKERVFPQQAEQKMLAFGQSNPRKYLPQYMSMWGKNQADLAAKVKIKHIKKVK